MALFSRVVPLTIELTVLFVEDHPQIRESTMESLEHYFKKMDVAENGAEGLSLYKKMYEQTGRYYDLVITDIVMPVMNGVEMIRHIKALHPEQKIIVLSAHSESDYLIELINLGISQYVSKPIDTETMLKALYKAGYAMQKIPPAGEKHIISLNEGCQYDTEKHILTCEGEPVKLTKNEMLMMDLLTTCFERVCTVEEILDYFRQSGATLAAENIRFLISKLRKKLPPDSIESLYGVGYKLTSCVSLNPELA